MKKLVIMLIILLLISILSNNANFDTNILQKFEPISSEHLLGTDYLGRDIYNLLVYGFKRTVQTVFIASIFALSLGLLAGFYAGYRGGIWLRALEIIANLGLVIPSFIVALIVSSIMGFNPLSIGISLGVFDFGVYALQVANLTQKIRHEDFIMMSRLLNIPLHKIFSNHLFPHIFPSVSALFASKASSIILRFSSLAFIGLGADITKPDWGMLLYQYRIYFLTKPLLLLAPTVCIFAMCLVFQFVFDSVEVSD